MLCIRRQGGKRKSAARCDDCGIELEWPIKRSFSQIARHLRGIGWSTGKRDLCACCGYFDAVLQKQSGEEQNNEAV